MDMDRLKEILRQWVSIETWNTPLDDRRFHETLHRAFSTLGTAIDGDQFSEVLHELIGEYYPDLEQRFKESEIERYSLRAEHIASYLHETTMKKLS